MFLAQKVITELSQFISYASVSSDSKQKTEMHACANWLVRHLQSIGMRQAALYKTNSHPVVFAEYAVHPALPTILFYGHYDVQPAEPGHEWNTAAFKAVVKGDYIYGRGASDDKGQFFIHVKAVEKLLKETGSLPVNIKFLVEGSEEIGSVGLKEFIQSHKGLLRCNAAVVSDTKMFSLNIPAITYALRGSLNAELFIQTSNKDLHSGTFGGYTPNAAEVLSNFISSLYKKDHSIAIPGFYDDVDTLSAAERKFIKENAISDKKLLQEAEAFSTRGEADYSLHERSTIRPSISVTGITTGFQGSGEKNIIPSAASAKFNFRLVPHQQPEKVRVLLNDYVKRMIPGTRIKIVYSSFNKPVMVDRYNPYVKAAVNAYETVFRQQVKFIQNGGTIGAVDHLYNVLNIPVVLMGFAQADDNMHAANERFYLPNFFRGIETSIKFMRNIYAKIVSYV